MTTTKQIAKHMRDVHFGGNWTVSNLKDTLSDVNHKEALKQVEDFNTIATLLFHINYFVGVASRVLEGGPLEGKDALSFDHPPIHSEEDWRTMVENALSDAEKFAALIEQLPDTILNKHFTDEKYGTYFRNLHGIIEHTHYHLGQIALIKKLVKK